MSNTIVVVDDCELLKWSLMKVLPHYADIIQYYDNISDAQEAAAKLEDSGVYIYIIDLEVASLSGIETLMCTMPQNRCHVILLTSVLSEYSEADIKKRGVLKIFTKPFNVSELANLILKLV